MCVCVTVRNYRRWWIGCVQECAKWPQFFFLLLWRSLSLMLLLFYRTKTLADWRFHFSSELPSNSRKKFCCLPAHLPKQKSKEKYGSPSQADSEKVSNGIGTTDILTKGENKKKTVLFTHRTANDLNKNMIAVAEGGGAPRIYRCIIAWRLFTQLGYSDM